MTFVRNCWYVAGWSDDFTHALTCRTILSEDIVLYRTSKGEVAAFLDVCPHRKLPLSKGRLIGDSLQCGYHGLTFDCSGKCVRIPGQDSTNTSISVVKKYPVKEHMGMVWLWMGDPALAEETPIFDLPQYHDKDWSAAHGDGLFYEANYLLLADNLCDPAHVSFVHKSTLGNEGSEDVPIETRFEDDCVITHRWINDSKPIPLFEKFGNFSGNVDRWHYYYYYAPNIAIIDFGSADAGTGAQEGGGTNRIQIYACHFMTPVTESQTIDYWLHVKNFVPESAEVDQKMSDQFRIAFSEDQAILEGCQKQEDAGHTWRPVRLAIDKGPIRMRKMVDKMIAAEAV